MNQRRYNPLSAKEFMLRQNQQYVRPGVTELDFMTQLSPEEEQDFRAWVHFHHVPFDPNDPTPQDYDMRGFWRALMDSDPRAVTSIDPNDNRMHYPDYWKTPYHESFSNESKFAGPNAPIWVGDQLRTLDGDVLFDDTQGRR